MKPELEKICADYIASREAVKKAFRWDSSALYAVCANIFCANGQTADADRLTECLNVIKKNTKRSSGFRSKKIRSILAGMLALGKTPEDRMALADESYRLLRRYFKGTEYLVLTAFLLTDLADQRLTEEKAARGKTLFDRMNRKHRILTNNTDSVFAMLLAFSDKPDDALFEDMEACFQALKARFPDGGSVQTASQVLAAAPGAPAEKAQRLIALYDALEAAKIKYGRSRELPPLAALSLTDTPIPRLVGEISEADAFLAGQKLYGSKEEDLRQRAMHAVMIVSDQYAGTDQVNVTVMTNTLDMLISKQQAAYVSFFFEALQACLQFFAESKKGTTDKAADGTDEKAGAENQP